MKLGANDISAVKIGATDVNKVYLGSNLVWEKAGSALLLDLYPNAAAAYSLRKLRTAYAGSAIRVRRSSDNTEQDIGFVDNELDTASLLAFVGSGDGFVTIWYDQSGGAGNNAINNTASTQPSIVVSGVINLFNNKPSIYANGNSLLDTNVFKYDDNNGQISTFGAVNLSTSGIVVDGDNSPRVFRGLQVTATTIRILSFYETGSFVFNDTPYTLGTNAVFSSIRKIGLIEIWNNNVSNGNTPTSLAYQQSPSYISLFQRANSNKITGFIPEIVIYPSDQSANRAGIESNINEYHNIYWDGSQTGLLDDYPNASAAYSLRALNSAYTGPAIRVRRSSDNAEQDINLLYDGSLNTDSLLAFVGSGDGFVTTWYDQSGGGNDVAQVSESAQPQIVNSGVVVTTSDNYAIDFSGSKTLVNETFDNSTQVSSVFTVAKSTSSVPQVIIDGVNLASRQVSGYYAGAPSVFAIYKGVTIKSAVPINTNINLLSTFFDVNSDLYLNGDKILDSVNAGNHTREGFTLGSGIGLAAPFEGSIFEIIVFDEQNKSSDRVGIETNINNHYTIY